MDAIRLHIEPAAIAVDLNFVNQSLDIYVGDQVAHAPEHCFRTTVKRGQGFVNQYGAHLPQLHVVAADLPGPVAPVGKILVDNPRSAADIVVGGRQYLPCELTTVQLGDYERLVQAGINEGRRQMGYVAPKSESK